jgi:hypothetical protein
MKSPKEIEIIRRKSSMASFTAWVRLQSLQEFLSISVFLKLSSGQNALARIIKTSPKQAKSFMDSFLSKVFRYFVLIQWWRLTTTPLLPLTVP